MRRRSFIAGAAAAPVVPAAVAPMVQMHENDVRPVGEMPVVNSTQELQALMARPSVVYIKGYQVFAPAPFLVGQQFVFKGHKYRIAAITTPR